MAEFLYAGHRHILVKAQRRYGQAGYLIQRMHEGERCGHAYWVSAVSLPKEAHDACADPR